MRIAKSFRYVYQFDRALLTLKRLTQASSTPSDRSFALYEQAQVRAMVARHTKPGVADVMRLFSESGRHLESSESPRQLLIRHATLDFLANLEPEWHNYFAVNASNFDDAPRLRDSLQTPFACRRYADVLMVRAEWEALTGRVDSAIHKVREMVALADHAVASDVDSFLPRAYASLGHARKCQYLESQDVRLLHLAAAAYSASLSLYHSQHTTGGMARMLLEFAKTLNLLGCCDLAYRVLSFPVTRDHYWNHIDDIQRINASRSRLEGARRRASNNVVVTPRARD